MAYFQDPEKQIDDFKKIQDAISQTKKTRFIQKLINRISRLHPLLAFLKKQNPRLYHLLEEREKINEEIYSNVEGMSTHLDKIMIHLATVEANPNLKKKNKLRELIENRKIAFLHFKENSDIFSDDFNTEIQDLLDKLAVVLVKIEENSRRISESEKIEEINRNSAERERINEKNKRIAAERERIRKEILDNITTASNNLGQLHSRLTNLGTYLVHSEKNDFKKNGKNIELAFRQFIENTDLFSDEFDKAIAELAKKFQRFYQDITDYNWKFIIKRKKENEWLWEKLAFSLDNEQLTAIITDDTHNLVVAGAGAGKTEVLITRIAYLTKRKPDTIMPNRILALAFQKKAASEIEERLKTRFGLEIKVKTFHALGLEINKKAREKRNEEVPQHKDEPQSKKLIHEIYTKQMQNSEFQQKVINYLKYSEDEEEKELNDFRTKQEYYEHMRKLRYTALDGTKVKSLAEREILNFFLSHLLNGKQINIQYETPAEWMLKETENRSTPKPDFYFPELKLYLEHWALKKNGKVPEWFAGDDPTALYRQKMDYKKKQFEKQDEYGLIETSSWESVEPNFQQILEKRFLDAVKEKSPNEEFKLTQLDYVDLVNKTSQNHKEYVKGIPAHISKFITISKTNGLASDNVREILNDEKWTAKQSLFAEIALHIFDEYTRELDDDIDFADMINLAIEELDEDKSLFSDLFSHILVDEYQDISHQRYRLLQLLMNRNNGCKIFCVGDDWQSIMGFSGSDIDHFVNFKEYFNYPEITKLGTNYRSQKKIVEVGSAIIKKNGSSQIAKEVYAEKEEIGEVSVFLLRHEDAYLPNYYRHMAHRCVDQITTFIEQGYKPSDIFILARYNSSSNKTLKNELERYADEKKLPFSTGEKGSDGVRFMTVHKSKGLQAKIVFILDFVKGLYGFPCEMEDPDIYMPAMLHEMKDKREEERRLFYVAVTRGIEKVFIYSRKGNESEFLKEISEYIPIREIPY